jgi:hypothetical protein
MSSEGTTRLGSHVYALNQQKARTSLDVRAPVPGGRLLLNSRQRDRSQTTCNGKPKHEFNQGETPQ